MQPFDFTDPAFHRLFEVYFFLLGAIFGSFLNVCIYRIPLHESIVTERSHCPRCKNKIPWYYNIPILSYFILRGRCAYCKERISPVYPLVEILTAVLFLLLYERFGISSAFLIYAVFACCMLVLVFIDYYHKILPVRITIPGIVFGVVSSFYNPFLTPRQSLTGMVLGALILLIVYLVYHLIRKKEGLGQGDIFMLAMVGAFLGWQQVLIVLFFSSLLGSLVGLIFILLLRKDFGYALPYGTFIGLAALPAIFWGQRIWSLYFSI